MKIEIDEVKINNKFFSDKKQAELSAKVKEFMAPFVPRESGMLMDSARVEGDTIVYDMPYAKRMYYGTNLNFSKEINPLASAKWDRAMVTTKGDALLKEVERIIKK